MSPDDAKSQREHLVARSTPEARLALVKGALASHLSRILDAAKAEARRHASAESMLVDRFHRALVPQLGDKAPGEHPEAIKLEPFDELAVVKQAMREACEEVLGRLPGGAA